MASRDETETKIRVMMLDKGREGLSPRLAGPLAADIYRIVCDDIRAMIEAEFRDAYAPRASAERQFDPRASCGARHDPSTGRMVRTGDIQKETREAAHTAMREHGGGNPLLTRLMGDDALNIDPAVLSDRAGIKLYPTGDPLGSDASFVLPDRLPQGKWARPNGEWSRRDLGPVPPEQIT